MMKSLLKFILLIIICPVVSVTSDAQEMKAEVPAAVQNLMKFVGDWDGSTTLALADKNYKLNYSVSCKKTADGNGLYIDEWFSHPELGTLKGANLVGFDPFDAKIKWFTVDNMGTTHEHVGEWETPDHLFIEHVGLREGKKYIEKINFRFTGTNELHFKLAATLDGSDAEKVEGIFHKKK